MPGPGSQGLEGCRGSLAAKVRIFEREVMRDSRLILFQGRVPSIPSEKSLDAAENILYNNNGMKKMLLQNIEEVFNISK